MSNFIKKVVDIVNENDNVDARKNLTKLNNEIKTYQKQVRKCIETNYANIIPEVVDNEMYITQGEALMGSVNQLEEYLNTEAKAELEKCTEDVDQLRMVLEENAIGLRTCLKLIQIDEKLKEIRKLNKSNNFSHAINVLAELKALIHADDDRILPRLDCYTNLKINYVQESEQLMYNVKQRFEQLVEFKDKTFQNTKAVSIRISKDENQLHETTMALVSTHYNPRSLCTFLIENIFRPVFNRQVNLKLHDTDTDEVRLLVSYNLELTEPVTRCDYRIVFRNIKKIFTCLSYMNISLAENRCIFVIFAENIKNKFLESLIAECLSFAIPTSIAEMNESKLVEDIRDLNDFLNNLLFINPEDPDDQRLLAYADKIGVLFGKRFAANVLHEALVLMKKDLHDAVKLEKPLLHDSVLTDCMVSKSIFAMTDQLDKLYKNSLELPDEQGAEQMLTSVATILERYVQEVTEYHEKLLVNIPQQSAFFHNNCLYLSEWIKIHLADVQDHLFENVGQYLQQQGAEQLSSQVYRQRKTLQEFMDALELGTEMVEELGPEPTRVIRQCLRQLEVLKNVWENILPDSIYTENMAILLNDCVTEFVRRICTMEDIPSMVASELEEIIELIQKKGPGLFKDPLTIHTVVKSWMKLTQLKMILGASLLQITEQWSEGKGPLTVNFKADEVKKLIRALFQNTDRRANALASII